MRCTLALVALCLGCGGDDGDGECKVTPRVCTTMVSTSSCVSSIRNALVGYTSTEPNSVAYRCVYEQGEITAGGRSFDMCTDSIWCYRLRYKLGVSANAATGVVSGVFIYTLYLADGVTPMCEFSGTIKCQ